MSHDEAVNQEKWWKIQENEVSEKLGTSIHVGLSREEVIKRQKQYGFNLLPEKTQITPWKLFWLQFANFLVFFLLGATLIALLVGDWIAASAIVIIVILNALLGFIQEYKAERSLASLKKLMMPMTRVIREGKLEFLPSKEIVPGDLVLVESGDLIPADGRIVVASQFATQEALLTGESLPIQKDVSSIEEEDLAVADQKNMVFTGTTAVSGKAYIIVTSIGEKTELGKIAALLQSANEGKTPLQIKLEKFGRSLVFICLGIVAIVFILGVIAGNSVIEMLLTSISLAVAAVPEGLPAVVTFTLAIGIKRMAKQKALIRRLPSIETLGCTDVICTDKTGTLTENKMLVKYIWAGQKIFEISGEGYEPSGNFTYENQPIKPETFSQLILALKIGVLCNNAELIQKEGVWEIIGDPTEGALLVAACKAGLLKIDLEKEHPLIDELPFDSERKRMSVLRKASEEKILYVKGALDIVLNHSSKILGIEENSLLEEEKKNIMQFNKNFANQGLRVLALAYKEGISKERIFPDDEKNLTLVALIAMSDPPRASAKEAIFLCKQAGIRVLMITGDHQETAMAIGSKLGLESKSLSGQELAKLNDEELISKIDQVGIFARVTAEHKLRIVRALKKENHVVAMTGDGVNDAPAVKEADIGISMGITGTDVTRQASDMIILDDNFASIVNAVKEGRGIYNNIYKFVSYILSTNIAEVLVVFLGVLLGFKDKEGNPFVILTAVQLLWLNLITDGLPALAIGIDSVSPKAMFQPPRSVKSSIISWRAFFKLSGLSIIIAAAALIACYIGLQQNAMVGQSMAFTTLVVTELMTAQLIRGSSFFSNIWFVVAVIFSIFIHLLVLYIPFLQTIFNTVSLRWQDWIWIGLLMIVVFVLSKLYLFFAKPFKQTA